MREAEIQRNSERGETQRKSEWSEIQRNSERSEWSEPINGRND